MRIGILTLPLRSNYGGILQAYALQTVLEKIGHEVQVIGMDNIRALPPFYVYFCRLFRKFVLRQDVHVFSERDNNRYVRTVFGEMQRFIDLYIHMSHMQFPDGISSSVFDTIIVGSDQIWRRDYFCSDYHRDMGDAFLYFTKEWNIRRIAYAASFGIDEWDYDKEETCKCAEMVNYFAAIGVRESSGIDLCQKYLRCEAVHVLDPTLLLEKDDYMQLVYQPSRCEQAGLLSYILDPSDEKLFFVQRMAQETSTTSFSVIAYGANEVMPSVESWLKGFNDAQFVVTDSFHACVFSLIFNKPFIVIANKRRGLARMESLLHMFNQEYRLISDVDGFVLTDEVRKAPNAELSVQKSISLDFLKQALNY